MSNLDDLQQAAESSRSVRVANAQRTARRRAGALLGAVIPFLCVFATILAGIGFLLGIVAWACAGVSGHSTGFPTTGILVSLIALILGVGMTYTSAQALAEVERQHAADVRRLEAEMQRTADDERARIEQDMESARREAERDFNRRLSSP